MFFERDVADVQEGGDKLDDGAELSVFDAHHAHAVGCVGEGVGVGYVRRRVAEEKDEKDVKNETGMLDCLK